MTRKSGRLKSRVTCCLPLSLPSIEAHIRNTPCLGRCSNGEYCKDDGHTNIRTTQGYVKVTDDKISEDMDKLMEKRKNYNSI